VIAVRSGAEADAMLAADLHVAEISDGFLSSLGRPFLTRLYRRVLREPGSFLLVAESDGNAIGFIAGAEDVGALYRAFIRHDGVPATIAALPKIVRSWRRVWETLRYPAGGHEDAAPLPAAELLSVAVAPAARGRGVGRLLVQAFTTELTRRRVAGARVVVGADNEAAIRLYEQCGFAKVARIEVHRGTPSQVLTWP
jgi:ribosomal protein S18 acetylase RimI-like enzyme